MDKIPPIPQIQYTHAAIVISQDYIDVIPVASYEAALEYLRKRSEAWEEHHVYPELNRKTATLEQLNQLFADSDPSDACMITIGTIETPYIQPSLLDTSDWYWRDSDGCPVAGTDEEYILLPSPIVNVTPEHRALIAAAPDLLAISETMFTELEGIDEKREIPDSINHLLPKLRAAIFKARQIAT